jgi:hypothetical protein
MNPIGPMSPVAPKAITIMSILNRARSGRDDHRASAASARLVVGWQQPASMLATIARKAASFAWNRQICGFKSPRLHFSRLKKQEIEQWVDQLRRPGWNVPAVSLSLFGVAIIFFVALIFSRGDVLGDLLKSRIPESILGLGDFLKSRAFMHRHVIRFLAFDQVLRLRL